MSLPLKVLVVDDSDEDASLLRLALINGGYDVTYAVVDNASDMRTALESRNWDVIASDHAMPNFSAPKALALAKELQPGIPFIIVSGEIDLNLAVSLMRSGAKDFIQKRELPRLIPAIERELQEVMLRREAQRVHEELEMSETRYRRLFETAQDGILILDADTGFVIDANQFLIAMLGYSKEEFLGKKLWELGAFKDAEASKQAYLELQKKGYIRYDNLPLQTADGKQVSVEFVSNIYMVDHMRIAQCNIRDITERELSLIEIQKLNTDLEQRVQKRTLELESIIKELEAFNYSVSHDLRAPLRRVKGFAEALRDDAANRLSVESLKYIQNIRVSLERMNVLIEALLGLARFSRLELKRHPVDLSAIVHFISAEIEQNSTRQVEFVVAEGIMVDGDEQLLRIVLENLVGNAWKFTANNPTACIEFGIEPQPDGSIAYFVRDDGAGFNMEYAQKLFSAFQRFHSEKEFPGIGVGLATVQRIIHRHGGRVWAESVVDEGSTFYFTIA
jgi:PAS domain S-box-containing protein